MSGKDLIGKRVMQTKTKEIGRIEDAAEDKVEVSFHGRIDRCSYPAAFSSILELEDEDISEETKNLRISE